MKLNGLTNNLKGNDSSLSNSYLSHIVELLRNEVESLSNRETTLETTVTDHITTQAEKVDTVTVNATEVNTNKVNTANINDKILFLQSAIEVFNNLKVNGHNVVTEEQFTGPFRYLGDLDNLPETAEPGDVCIVGNAVYVYGNNIWKSYDIPLGTVSRTEYDTDKQDIFTAIGDLQIDLGDEVTDRVRVDEEINTALGDIERDIDEINTALDSKVDKNPEDDKAYVRQNDEWVEMATAQNSVKEVSGDSVVSNTETGVNITSPKIELNSNNIKVNGDELTEYNKFYMEVHKHKDRNYYYEMKFGRSPYSSVSSIQQGWCTYNNDYQESQKSPPEKRSIFTKNWQYCKFNLSGSTGGDNNLITITAMDKDGNINEITNAWTDWTETSTQNMMISSFFTFNQEYVPDDWEDTVYMFMQGTSGPATTNKPSLIEFKDGELSRRIDIYNGTGKLKEQGFVPSLTSPDYSHYCSTGGGKGLRNKDIQRLCFVTYNTASSGGTFAVIIGGDRRSNVTDPFDPTKAIYVPLPANAYYSYDCMAATDSAWYLQENGTGRMMRITPDGQVSEINLTEAVTSCGFNYIEYTDKNGRPAAAYYVHNTASGGGHYVVFLEEEEDGSVNAIEKKVESTAHTPTGGNWYAQLFKFCENSHYIFFTASCGLSVSGSTSYGAAAMHNMLWYWDKQTHTTHAINNFYDGIGFQEYDFIEMHKTKGNAIWFPYLSQDMPKAERTGEIHYVSDIDYTNIVDGVDTGSIEVMTATVGTEHAFFTASGTNTVSTMYYTYPLQGSPSWGNGGIRNQLSATNDDGILCIMSADLMAYALCYGDGNIKVYECTSHDGVAASSTAAGGRFDCDPDKIPIIPDEPYTGTTWYAGHPCLFGMSHGWVLSIYPSGSVDMWDYDGTQNRSYTYIGLQYRNWTPNILIEPHYSKVCRTGSVYFPQSTKFEKYSYLQTYDDYERRKKVLGEIRANLQYGVGSTGTDSYFKEVRKENKVLLLEYEDVIVCQVEL